MTSRKMIEFPCPVCENRVALDFVQSANITQDPKLLEKILDLKLNVATCLQCGKKILVDDLMLYNDMERKLLISKYPYSELKNWELVIKANSDQWAQLPDQLKLVAKNRIVFGPFALKEKILLAQKGIDDKAVEVYKIGLLGQLGEKYFNGQYRVFYLETDTENNHYLFVLVNMVSTKEESMIKVPVETFDNYVKNNFESMKQKDLIKTVIEPPFVSMEKMFFKKNLKFDG